MQIAVRQSCLLAALAVVGFAPMAHANRVTSTLEFHVLESVGYPWQPITFDNNYTAPVVVCSYVLADENDPPATVRLNNVGPTSADVRIQQFEDSSVVTAGTVFCIVSETGAYTLPGGMQFEARTVVSDETSSGSGGQGWNQSRLENITGDLTQTYSNPVLVGQVMSFNDTLASVFHATDCEQRQNRPFQGGFSDGACVGKHIGQINGTRASETLGYMVIENGTGNANNIFWQAGRTGNNVAGTGNNPPYSNSVSRDFDAGVGAMAGENGGNGGWWVFYGADPLPSGQISGAIEEETVAGDRSRSHINEEVNYWLFEDNNAPVLTLDKTAPETDFGELGEVITFSYEIENTGNVSISSITLDDDQIGAITCPATTLAASASFTCTADYTVTAADITAGSVTNIATTDGDPDFGKLDEATDTWTLTYAPGPANFTVEKTVEYETPGSYSLPGEDVIYQLVITNEGEKSPDDGTLFLVDQLPPEVAIFGGNFEASGGPVSFAESGTGLSVIGSGTIGFSRNTARPVSMLDCGETPSAPYDATITYVCLAPSGTFAGANPDPSFTIRFQARLQ
ncbi:MAG: hypothetical protein AAF216_07155 [Pseudomonadota bacterium]